MSRADRDDGIKPGPTTTELAELRDAKRRIRMLEQENEVLRRRCRVSVAVKHLPEMTFPLVRELACDAKPEVCSRGRTWPRTTEYARGV